MFDAEQDDAPETALIDDLERFAAAACVRCGVALCGHAVLSSVALGFRGAPRCVPCLAAGLRKPSPELAEQLMDYVQRRDCYRRAWDIASDREGVSRLPKPTCMIFGQRAVERPVRETITVDDRPPAVHWDAGPLACGDLVMELRLRMRDLPPGAVIQITALDPAAPEDLPAWCRLTGHRLTMAEHPVYRIKRA